MDWIKIPEKKLKEFLFLTPNDQERGIFIHNTYESGFFGSQTTVVELKKDGNDYSIMIYK